VKSLPVFLRKLKILPRWVIVLIDTGFILFSTLTGYLLRFNFSTSDLIANQFYFGIAIYGTCGFLAIIATGSYRGIIRYTAAIGVLSATRVFRMVLEYFSCWF